MDLPALLLSHLTLLLFGSTGTVHRVMSLRDGRVKMSKSDALDASRINLTDDADTIAKKVGCCGSHLGTSD